METDYLGAGDAQSMYGWKDCLWTPKGHSVKLRYLDRFSATSNLATNLNNIKQILTVYVDSIHIYFFLGSFATPYPLQHAKSAIGAYA